MARSGYDPQKPLSFELMTNAEKSVFNVIGHGDQPQDHLRREPDETLDSVDDLPCSSAVPRVRSSLRDS
jgi:hypothetical protein